MKRLDKLGAIDHASKKFVPRSFDFSSHSALQLDDESQFNYIKIGSSLWGKATDKLDDVYGALGSFVIKAAFTKGRIHPAR